MYGHRDEQIDCSCIEDSQKLDCKSFPLVVEVGFEVVVLVEVGFMEEYECM